MHEHWPARGLPALPSLGSWGVAGYSCGVRDLQLLEKGVVASALLLFWVYGQFRKVYKYIFG